MFCHYASVFCLRELFALVFVLAEIPDDFFFWLYLLHDSPISRKNAEKLVR